MAAEQPRGRGQHRRDEVVDALVAAHQHDRDRDARDHRRGRERDPLDRAGADLAEHRVADDQEEHEDHADVEQPLGHDRAEHGAARRRRARRHQHDPHRVAGARRQHVVDRVADRGQRVGVRARGPRAVVEQQPVPALGAHERVDGVERDRADAARRSAPAPCGSRGGVLAQRPPHHAGERDDGDDDAEHRPHAAQPAAPARLRRRRRSAGRCRRGRSRRHRRARPAACRPSRTTARSSWSSSGRLCSSSLMPGPLVALGSRHCGEVG